jgi:PBP1b-binding outer membrane lipoprotein LpoB
METNRFIKWKLNLQKTMKMTKRWLPLILISVLFFAGCKKEDILNEEEVKEQAPALTQKINSFIKDVMTDVYLV